MSIINIKRKPAIQRKNQIDTVIEECEQYRSDLIQYCAQFFGFEIDYAEDCVQEAYVALYNTLSQGTEICNCKAWLYKVVLNHKNKTLKDIARRNEQDFSDTEEKDLTIQRALSYEPDYAEEIVTEETIEERAIIILSSLNNDEQYLYFAYYRDKKNLKEIAKDLGISHTAARQRHVELRKKIIRMVKDYEKF